MLSRLCWAYYIEHGQISWLDQNDNIHSIFLFVQRMCNSLQNQLQTKLSLVETLHEIVWIVDLFIDLYLNAWCIYRFLPQTSSKNLYTDFIYLQINPFGNNIWRRWSRAVHIFISLSIDSYIRKWLIIHINIILWIKQT